MYISPRGVRPTKERGTRIETPGGRTRGGSSWCRAHRRLRSEA